MKILKQEDISKWNYEYKCTKCNTDLLIDKDDLHYMSDYYNSDESFYADCVVCDNRFYIEPVIVPALLKVQLRKKK